MAHDIPSLYTPNLDAGSQPNMTTSPLLVRLCCSNSLYFEDQLILPIFLPKVKNPPLCTQQLVLLALMQAHAELQVHLA